MLKAIVILNYKYMKRIIYSFILFFINLISSAQAVQPGEWTRVREYGHAYNINDFTSDEYQWIKDHYSLFTIEKRHAKYVYGDVSSETASIATAAKLKENNSTIKPLFYWNVKVVYDGIYQTIQDALAIHPEWVGDVGWDWTHPELKQWTIDILNDYGVDSGHAGVFLDQVMAFQGDEQDIFDIMDSVSGIVIYNGYTPRGTESNPVIAATQEYLKHSSGVYVEHFFHGSHIKYVSQGKALMDSLLDVPNDKIIIAMSSADTTYWNAPDHKFSLAAYLIIANDNSYYHYTESGLLASDYMTYWHSDFEKTLGAPLAKAKVNGYVYTRTFENASVRVDLLNKTSSIDWVEQPSDDPIENLAVLGTATQSSTNYSAEASRANDGDTNGAFGGGSVTHTQIEENPWWQVDFGDSYSIGEISVFNRTDEGAIARLSNFTVYVLDEDSSAVYSQTYTSYPSPSVTMDAGGVNGRYVVVQINGTTSLCLAEVQVAESVVSESTNTVSFKVLDAGSNDSIPLAHLFINGMDYTVNYVGEATLSLPDNVYSFTLSKEGYETFSDTLDITQDTSITLQLEALPTHELSIKVTERGSYIGLSEVSLSINDKIYSTNKIGGFSITLLEGLYNVTLSQAGYHPIDISIDLVNDTLLNVKMDRQQYNLSFKVVDAALLSAIPNVSIAINDTVYISDTLGMLSLDLDFDAYDYVLSVEGYTDVSQTIDLIEDTLLTISMEAIPSRINSLVSEKMFIYPNPVTHTFSLLTAAKEVSIFALSGERVIHFNNTQNQYDISSLAKGIYVVNAADFYIVMLYTIHL